MVIWLNSGGSFGFVGLSNIFRGCFQLQHAGSEPMSKQDGTVSAGVTHNSHSICTYLAPAAGPHFLIYTTLDSR